LTFPGPGHLALIDRIREEIRAAGPLTFARFMELALHHPRYGYYAAGPRRLGECGDFITASDLGPAFGRAVARQIAEFDRRCGEPDPFDIVEIGAGRGSLARDILGASECLGDGLRRRVRYTAVDASKGMRRAIAETVPAIRIVDEPPGATTGCVLAVELFDALPIHRIARRDGRLVEIGVGWDGARLHDALLEPNREVRAWAKRYGAAAEEGFEAEVCLGLREQVSRWDRGIERGFAIVLDYGDTADRLYTAARKRGTLLAYHAQRAGEEYLARIGEQDLTAHVNFSALTDAAEAAGWSLAGHTTQDRFLIANGILESFEQMDDAAYRDPRRIRERMGIKQLIQSTGMGRMFQAWVFCKGFDTVPPLDGLSDPFAR